MVLGLAEVAAEPGALLAAGGMGIEPGAGLGPEGGLGRGVVEVHAYWLPYTGLGSGASSMSLATTSPTSAGSQRAPLSTRGP